MKPIKFITVACPRCEKRHKIAPDMIGKPGKCKRCAKEFDLRPKEAKAEPGSSVDFDLGAPSTEKEYYIPVSLTSNPMVDKEYEKESRAQTSFLKLPEREDSWFQRSLLFAAVFLVISVLALLGYWFLIRR